MDLRLEGVHKRFGIAVALTDVDLAIGVDTHLLLVGTNGAGKTTLLRLLLGELVIFPRKSGHAQAASLVECNSNAAGVA